MTPAMLSRKMSRRLLGEERGTHVHFDSAENCTSRIPLYRHFCRATDRLWLCYFAPSASWPDKSQAHGKPRACSGNGGTASRRARSY